MLYWFFVKLLGPLARIWFKPTVEGTGNIPKQGAAIIASNHLAVIDDALLPITCPRMIHFMGKAEYFNGKGIKGKFKKWWFSSVGVFPVDRSGGSKSLGAMETARSILEHGHIFGIHPEGTRSPDGRLYRGHTGVARLAFETGTTVVPAAIIGTRELQKPGHVLPHRGRTKVIFGKPIIVPYVPVNSLTHVEIRNLTDRIMQEIQEMSRQRYVDVYAQVIKAHESKQELD